MGYSLRQDMKKELRENNRIVTDGYKILKSLYLWTLELRFL